MIRKLLFKLKQGTEERNYGRENIVKAAIDFVGESPSPLVVDLGAGYGTDLMNIKDSLNKGNYVAVEDYPPYRKHLGAKGIKSYKLNIEVDKLPFVNDSVDLIIANQIIEHVKEIFWIFSEIHRTLKPEGVAVIGVPNLASFHNRVGLLFGLQPTSIELYSAHVRGITAGSFKRFIEKDGYFKVQRVQGANFYPFSNRIASVLERIFPRASAGITITIQKKKDGNFLDILGGTNFETPFYRGPSKK